jgi:hypothetical protein
MFENQLTGGGGANRPARTQGKQGPVSKSSARKVRSKKVPQMFGCKKAQLCALGEDALNSIRRALQTETRGRVAFEVLTAIGVIPEKAFGPRRRSALRPGILECPISKLSAADLGRPAKKS